MADNAPQKPVAGPSAEIVKKKLMHEAISYLGRYASSSANLEAILHKFAARKLGQIDSELVESAVKATLQSCVELGYVDDEAFIQSRFRQGLRSGHSQKQILQKLAQKGIARDTALAAMQDHRDDLPSDDRSELAAALIYARKKSIGPYARTAELSPEDRHKQFGRLARRGFPFEVARTIMALSSADEANALLDEIELS